MNDYTAASPLSHALDHIELYVANASSGSTSTSPLSDSRSLGFEPEAGFSDRASYILRQGAIHLVVDERLGEQLTAVQRLAVAQHGDGGVIVPRSHRRRRPVSGRAEAWRQGSRRPDEHIGEEGRGSVRRGAIAVYGDVIHTVIERRDYDGPSTWRSCAIGQFRQHGADAWATSIDHSQRPVSNEVTRRRVDFYERLSGSRASLIITDAS